MMHTHRIPPKALHSSDANAPKLAARPSRKLQLARALVFGLVVGALMTMSASVHAAQGDLAVSLETEVLRPSSATVGAVTDNDAVISPGVTLGFGIGTAFDLDVVVGYRFLGVQRALESRALDLEAQSHVLVGGLRGRLPIVGRWLYVVGHVELEAQAAEIKAHIDGRTGSDSTWTAGATARGGLELLWTISDDLALRWRAVVGYSGRLDADFSDVRLSSEVPNTKPLDLGGLNLSGVVGGMHVDLRF